MAHFGEALDTQAGSGSCPTRVMAGRIMEGVGACAWKFRNASIHTRGGKQDRGSTTRIEYSNAERLDKDDPTELRVGVINSGKRRVATPP